MNTSRMLLLDIDGTLVESAETQRLSWTRWAMSCNIDPAPFLAAHGRTALDKIKDLAPWLTAEREANRIANYEAVERRGLSALPGALRVWRSSRPLGVVTSADRRLALTRLSTVGLRPDRPNTILVTADDVGRGKPDPEPYLLAAERLKVAPGDCTVVEDAPAGVASALAAGMRVVGLTTTVEARELFGAHMVLASLDEYLSWEASQMQR